MAAYLRLLGSPAIHFGGSWIEPAALKVTAVLFYLAYCNRWVSREELVYLFWPDTPEENARRNLRQLLTKIRRLAYTENLETEDTRLRWAVATDVGAFREAVAAQHWPQAVQYCRGELLQGFVLHDAPEFDSWLELERSELQARCREAALAFAAELEAGERHAQAAELLAGLMKPDPLDEAVLRRYLQALYLSGERGEALKAYESFTKALQEELGGEPEGATVQLVNTIRQGESLAEPSGPGLATSTTSARAEKARHNLPHQATSFIGRSAEKTNIAKRLHDPACRLLTLVGPGGMGKTRLAIEAAWNQVDSFSDGVWFVPLAPLSSPEFMVPALASALDFSFFGNQEPKAQLLGYLKDKEMLLVLDNLEHLLEGTSLINEVLASAPSVKVLATSRERLNLHAEWVFDLAGMAVPAGVVTDPQDFDAVQLFLQAAQQARAEFTVDDASLQAVTRICQLVEGMPLALELAASWLRLLRVEEVAAKLEAGMDFLEAPTRDVPARHRSVRAVFDHSWNLLQPREQEALRKLSVFRGGFILRAAETVAGTSLPLLLALINKSFLRRSSTGRFTQHPPVRQFTQERAQAHPGEKAQGEERHSLFYAAFLQERARWMRGGAQQQASLLEMDEELDNIRSAWRWAIEQHDVNALEQSLDCLYHFYYNRGLLQEGEDAFGEAAKGLEESVTLAKLLARQGVFAWSLYHLDLSEEISRRSLATLSRFGAPPDTFALINLACAPAMRMDWELAEERNFDLLNASKAKGDLWGMACALSNLGNIAIGRGALEGAEASLRESIALFRQLDDRWGLAMAVGNLGHLHLKLGRLEKAEPCLREGLGFAREVGHPSLIAGILGSLGTISYRLHQLEQAKRSYLESLAIYKERGSYGPPIPTEPHVFWPLMGLAETTHALEEYRESLGLYREALRIALAFEAYADAADVVVGMADLLTSMGEKEKALSLLSFSLSHPHTTKDSKEKAIRLFAGLAAELPAHVVVFAREQGNALSFQSSEQLLADAQVHEQSG